VNQLLLAWSLRRASKKLGFQKPITLTFLPSSADVVGSLGEELLIYYCVDEYSEFTGTDRIAMLQMESRLMEKSDLVVVSSNRLYETKRRHNPNTFLITHGVDVAHFRNACEASTALPEDCADLPRPVIGFFGLLADWVDLEIIRHMASSRPEWSFLVIGEIQTDTSALRALPNVRLLGRRSYQSLPSYCKVFDVAIMPFLVNELTLAANPLKIREYLAAGLPVVATPLPEVVKLNGLVHVARTSEEFLDRTEALLSKDTLGPRLSVSRLMEPESWDEKVEKLSSIIMHLTSQGRKRRRQAA
jgi:glycosyltransferase involved in cell wall biosynthesis